MRVRQVSNRRINSAGFTLTELIVTISIFTMLLAGASLSFRGATAGRNLRQAADDVRAAIYQTRGLALAPEVGRTRGSAGYRFRLADDQTYEIREIDVTHADGSIETGRVVGGGTLPDDLRFILPAGFTDLDFSIADQGQIVAPVASSGSFELTILRERDYPDSVRLVIYPLTGQVERIESE